MTDSAQPPRHRREETRRARCVGGLVGVVLALTAAPAIAAEMGRPYLVRDIDLTGESYQEPCEITCGPLPTYYGSLPNHLIAIGNRVLFTATDHVHGFEPWVSDGTEAGTHMLGDLRPGGEGSAGYEPLFTSAVLGKVGAVGLFWAAEDTNGSELWATDGTAGGTTRLHLPCSPHCDGLLFNVLPALLEGRLYFTAYDGILKHVFLYRTDGTSAGSQVVADLCPERPGLCFSHARELAVWKGELYYLVQGDHPPRLYRLPAGTGQSPRQVLTTCPVQRNLLPAGERLLFVGSCAGGPTGHSLYALDSADGSPRLLRGFGADTPIWLVAWGGGLAAFHVGETLWTTDGTAEGTRQVTGLTAAYRGVAYRDLLLVNGERDGEEGLFALSPAGAVTRLHSGAAGVPSVAGGLAYFAGSSSALGMEPWVTDGTPAGTRLLGDVNPGPGGSDCGGFVATGDRVFFAADDGEHDRELWAAAFGAPPQIVTPPGGRQVQEGAPASFTVDATGDAPLAYQWLRNGAPIPGATAASYVLPAATLADHGAQLAVVVSNAFGSVTSPPAALSVIPAPHGLLGVYRADTSPGVAPVQRVDAQIDFHWGKGSPAATIPADGFSVRWSGELEALTTGTYTFHVRSDDGARLWIDDQLVIDHWGPHRERNAQGRLALVGGRRHRIRLEYRDVVGSAVVRLLWTPPGMRREVIPTTQLFAVARDLPP
jgi:ELWxxDGT repeat protein